MKKTIQDRIIVCPKARNKSYEVAEAKEKPGFAICPVCGDYHRLKKEK